MRADLNRDERWLRFHDSGWICPCCGMRHAGVFDLACDRPDFWQGSDEKTPNSELRSAKNILTEDFCIIDGQHFFIRCVLEVPIVGSEGQQFGFGVWSTLSRKNFDLYVDSFDHGEQAMLGPWFGWLSNALSGFPSTMNLKCKVHPQDGRQRPLIELEPVDHPLAVAQLDGITFDQLLEIYALNGHDLREALSARD